MSETIPAQIWVDALKEAARRLGFSKSLLFDNVPGPFKSGLDRHELRFTLRVEGEEKAAHCALDISMIAKPLDIVQHCQDMLIAAYKTTDPNLPRTLLAY